MAKNPHAVALGRLGGARGGKARARTLSARLRREIARRGAIARATALGSRRRREIARKAAAERWARLPGILRPLFWAGGFEDLRWPRDEDLVMRQILSSNRTESIEWLRRRAGDSRIAAWIRQGKGHGLASVQMERWIDRPESHEWDSMQASKLPSCVRRLLKSYDLAALRWDDRADQYVIVREILVRGSDEARSWLGGVLATDAIRELVRENRGAGLAEPARAKLREALDLTVDDIPVRQYKGFE